MRFNTPSAIFLAELGLSSLKVFWWQRTLEFFNKLAASPSDSLFHMILLDNLHDAFQRGTRNFCRSLFQGLASVGYHVDYDPTVALWVDSMWPGLIGYAVIVMVHLLQMNCIWCLGVMLYIHFGNNMRLCLRLRPILCGLFLGNRIVCKCLSSY